MLGPAAGAKAGRPAVSRGFRRTLTCKRACTCVFPAMPLSNDERAVNLGSKVLFGSTSKGVRVKTKQLSSKIQIQYWKYYKYARRQARGNRTRMCGARKVPRWCSVSQPIDHERRTSTNTTTNTTPTRYIITSPSTRTFRHFIQTPI